MMEKITTFQLIPVLFSITFDTKGTFDTDQDLWISFSTCICHVYLGHHFFFIHSLQSPTFSAHRYPFLTLCCPAASGNFEKTPKRTWL